MLAKKRVEDLYQATTYHLGSLYGFTFGVK
jgi:hypothetical protein